MLKKLLLALFLAGLLAASAVAHGPSAILASYDAISQLLTVTVSHAVQDPKDHYIYRVEIKKDGEELLKQSFSGQFDRQKQLVRALIPGLKDKDELSILAVCNKIGAKKESVILALPGYTDVTPAQAQVLMEEVTDLVIIDVSPHYAEGHLPGALHYHLPGLQKRLGELDTNKTHLVYCHADGPSRSGAQTLADNGFSRVYRLEGNYSAWVKAGYPIEQ